MLPSRLTFSLFSCLTFSSFSATICNQTWKIEAQWVDKHMFQLKISIYYEYYKKSMHTRRFLEDKKCFVEYLTISNSPRPPTCCLQCHLLQLWEHSYPDCLDLPLARMSDYLFVQACNCSQIAGSNIGHLSGHYAAHLEGNQITRY